MRFTELDQTLKGRNRDGKKYANNTYLHRRGDDIALQYHSTDVATFKANGDIVLNSGGWFTSTTKERIAWVLSGTQFAIVQESGVWYIVKIIDGNTYNKANPRWRFTDGITLHTEADAVTGGLPDNPKANKTDKTLKARVKKYAQLCAEAIPLDKPGAGDCWYCSMSTTDNQSLGDAFKDTDHIDSHIKEGYIVPSLVYRALKEFGNTDFILSLVFNNPDKVMLDIAKERVSRSVYRYILKRKGYAL